MVSLTSLLPADDKAIFVVPNSSSGFGAPLAIPVGDIPGQVAIGDVAGNSAQDLIVSLPESHRLMILPGLGSGVFDALPIRDTRRRGRKQESLT